MREKILDVAEDEGYGTDMCLCCVCRSMDTLLEARRIPTRHLTVRKLHLEAKQAAVNEDYRV